MRVKRYHLVSAAEPEQLQHEVSKLIAEGWQPFGQMVVTQATADTGPRFYQPMVQFEGEIRS
jgi:hypothetical protein